MKTEGGQKNFSKELKYFANSEKEQINYSKLRTLIRRLNDSFELQSYTNLER